MVVTTSCYAKEARKLQLGRHGMSCYVTTPMAWLTKIWLICSYYLQIVKENELIADSLGPITELSQKPACYGFLRKECKTTQWISQHHHIDIEWELLSLWKSITELKLNKHQTMWNKTWCGCVFFEVNYFVYEKITNPHFISSGINSFPLLIL